MKNLALIFLGFGLGAVTLHLSRPSQIIVQEPSKVNPVNLPSRDMRANLKRFKANLDAYAAWSPNQQETYRKQYDLNPELIKEAYQCVNKITDLDK